ncbi:hypothetical protein [Halobacteriovorax sp. ZH5_bin.2]|uniref:hypothetical protein n=2 Tax=unclassified Halobacteriovorax TaxID=2639665 RepID=UPI003724911E
MQNQLFIKSIFFLLIWIILVVFDALFYVFKISIITNISHLSIGYITAYIIYLYRYKKTKNLVNINNDLNPQDEFNEIIGNCGFVRFFNHIQDSYLLIFILTLFFFGPFNSENQGEPGLIKLSQSAVLFIFMSFSSMFFGEFKTSMKDLNIRPNILKSKINTFIISFFSILVIFVVPIFYLSKSNHSSPNTIQDVILESFNNYSIQIAFSPILIDAFLFDRDITIIKKEWVYRVSIAIAVISAFFIAYEIINNYNN